MPTDKLLYLSRADVESIGLDMVTIINRLEATFKEKGEGRVEMPPKPGIHTQPDAFIHAMPAFIPAFRSAGIKWVSGYPENQKRGLPYISGLLILNDDETGLPLAVMDCTWITAYRTGAATALSAKYLARPNSQVAGILACGVQGRTNLEGLAALFPLKRVYAYDIVEDVQRRYVEEMSAKLGLEIVGVKTPKEAVIESELVVTAGPIFKHPTPTIEKDWLRRGSFASAVDLDSYWTAGALAQFDKLSTDDHAQYRYFKSTGYFQTTVDPYADLGEIVAGHKPRHKPRHEREDERTMAANIGLALKDIAVASEIHARALERGIGTWLPL